MIQIGDQIRCEKQRHRCDRNHCARISDLGPVGVLQCERRSRQHSPVDGLGRSRSHLNSFNLTNLSSYSKGTYVSISSGPTTTYWQALQDSPNEEPSSSSTQWRQVIKGVGRTTESELGSNSSVTINGGTWFTAPIQNSMESITVMRG